MYDKGDLVFDVDENVEVEVEADSAPVSECICGGGTKYGHRNESGGFCCVHYGNTCGYHADYEVW